MRQHTLFLSPPTFLPSFGLRLFPPLPTLLTYNPLLFFRATVLVSVFFLVPHAILIFVFLAVGAMFCFPHASVRCTFFLLPVFFLLQALFAACVGLYMGSSKRPERGLRVSAQPSLLLVSSRVHMIRPCLCTSLVVGLFCILCG